MLEIRRLDPADSLAFELWMRLYREAWQAFDPHAELVNPGECRAMLSPGPEASHALEGYLAYAGDLAVGSGSLQLRLADNRDRARVYVHVPPGHARGGVGTALLQALEDRARQLGRRHADAEPREDNPAAMALADRFGYRIVQTEVERRLPLPVDGALLDRLEAESLRHRGDYAVRVLLGPLPDALLASYCELKNRMNTDTPTGDTELEAGGRTPASMREQDRALAEGGCERITAIAQAPDGAVVGTAELVVQPDQPGISQWGTIVAPSARGHRLGMAMKVAAARVAQERHPERRFIVTDNAETNRRMVAINEALGFEVYARYAWLTKEL